MGKAHIEWEMDPKSLSQRWLLENNVPRERASEQLCKILSTGRKHHEQLSPERGLGVPGWWGGPKGLQERDERNHTSSALFPHRRAYFTKGAFFDKRGGVLTPWLWKLP